MVLKLAILFSIACVCSAGIYKHSGHGNQQRFLCIFNGMTYWIGQTFPAGDGCNTCTCRGFNQVACTLVFCGDLEKPGYCPNKPYSDCSNGQICLNDYDCPHYQKCCRTGFRCKVCVNPIHHGKKY